MIAPPETKRAAPDRATRDTTTDTANNSATTDNIQPAFVVACMKADGRRVPFQTYGNRAEAESVAQQLRHVGCACSIEATP